MKKWKSTLRKNAHFTAASNENSQQNKWYKLQFHANTYLFKVHIDWTFYSSILNINCPILFVRGCQIQCYMRWIFSDHLQND